MGGPCSIRLDCTDERLGRELIDDARTRVAEIEQRCSRYRSDSLISRINHRAGSGEATEVDAETQGLFQYAQTLWEQSEGLFDPTSGVLRRAWNFKHDQLPAQSEIDALLPLISWPQVSIQDRWITLPIAGMELDFGGFVKEYAADAALSVLTAGGIDHALVELAGDVAISGPQGSGEAWPVGISDPLQPSTALAEVKLSRGGLATSGDYHRCIEIGGRRYGHVLSPIDGWPVPGLASVSVVADQCLVAGSMATLALLKPAVDAYALLESLGLPWLALSHEGEIQGSISS